MMGGGGTQTAREVPLFEMISRMANLTIACKIDLRLRPAVTGYFQEWKMLSEKCNVPSLAEAACSEVYRAAQICTAG